MKLFHYFPTRSCRPHWMCQELGLSPSIVHVDASAGAQKAPDYLALHPHGWLPSLETDSGDVLRESAALTLHLALQHPEMGMGATIGDTEFGRLLEWCVYGPANFDPPVFTFLGQWRRPESERDPAQVELAVAQIEECLRVMGLHLDGRDYILGDRFTAADVVIGYDLFMLQMMGLSQGNTQVRDYFTRLSARAAFRRTFSPGA